MNGSHRRSLLVVCLLSLAPSLALAQDTPAPAPAAQTGRPPRGPRPNPTNIKALPKDITGDDVIKLMHQYEGDLGVECEYCHARNAATRRNDFPSDANPVKEKARLMIKMTDDLNTKFLAQLSDHKSTDAVTCGTCHRGMAHPDPFVPKPHEPGNRPPAAAQQPSPQPPAL
jgi:cytochrome c553